MAGGETTLDSVAQDNSQSSLSLGLTARFQVSDASSMKATWMNALTDAVDGVNLNIARFQFFYAWNQTAQRMQREAPAGR